MVRTPQDRFWWYIKIIRGIVGVMKVSVAGSMGMLIPLGRMSTENKYVSLYIINIPIGEI
jgi:hypothetical protein